MKGCVDVVFVSGEPLWPSHHGGRLRASHIVEELGRRLSVMVVAPAEAPAPAGVRLYSLPDGPPGGRLAVVSPRPRVGRALLDRRRQAALRHVLAREHPGAVVFASSPLAAMAPPLDVPMAVDFVDIDLRRMASFARSPDASLRSRGAAGVEYLKARRWEPAVARRSALVAAPAADDVRLLASWGATAVHVPNGAGRFDVSPSPPDGPVTFVASFDYLANAGALPFVLAEVWPRLRREVPGLRLRIAGRAAGAVGAPPGVEVVSEPDDIGPVYRDASVVLAPVRVGGGTQLKVTEALARGRTVVATSFSARSAPAAAAGAVLVADDAERFAAHVVHLWRDLAARRAGEKALAGPPVVPTWAEACVPLVDGLERVVARR